MDANRAFEAEDNTRMAHNQRVSEYVKKMQELSASGDTEGAHVQADALLCEILRNAGYGPVADVFEKSHFWYA